MRTLKFEELTAADSTSTWGLEQSVPGNYVVCGGDFSPRLIHMQVIFIRPR